MKQMPQIEFPCPESITEMTPVKGGRHCKSCYQKIYDVTDMSESQIEVLKQNVPNLCVSYEVQEDVVTPKLFSIRKFALAVLVVFGTGMFSFTNAQLSDEIGNVKEQLLNSKEQKLPEFNLKVRIYNQFDETIKGQVSIVLPNGKRLISFRSEEGFYYFLIPEYCKDKTIVVELISGKKKKNKKLKNFAPDELKEVEIKLKTHYSKKRTGHVVGYF